jgi:hypothetical protein
LFGTREELGNNVKKFVPRTSSILGKTLKLFPICKTGKLEFELPNLKLLGSFLLSQAVEKLEKKASQ